MVVCLYVCYLTFIGYMASYDIAYVPNFVMFINFIFDNYDGQKKIENYVQAIRCGEKKEGFGTKSSELRSSELANTSIRVKNPTTNDSSLFVENSEQSSKEWGTKWKNQFVIWYNQLLLMIYTKGKKIKVYRT